MFSIMDFHRYKQEKKIITMMTAYDFTSGKIVERAGIDTILVGDSLGMVIQGNETTISVTVEEMLYHCKAVRKGAPNTFIIADMPYLSYHVSIKESIINAARLIREGGANAVKVEVNHETTLEHIRALTQAQIPVVAHVGMTPQSINLFGSFKVRGKKEEEAEHIISLIEQLENSGAVAVVLECIPASLSEKITKMTAMATIGIGAGVSCDGQILIFHDVVGLTEFPPKFSEKYINGFELFQEAIATFSRKVKSLEFPSQLHSFKDARK